MAQTMPNTVRSAFSGAAGAVICHPLVKPFYGIIGNEERGKPYKCMIDNIPGNSAKMAGMTARLKVSQPTSAQLQVGLTASERQLSAIVDIGAPAQKKAQDMRKLDAYLRLFNTALKYLNGSAARYVPQYSKVEVEFVAAEKKPNFKIDA